VKEFRLENHEYIQLNQLLKLLNLAGSGGEANLMITSGLIRVNQNTELQKRKKLKPGDIIEFQEHKIVITD
jgi:ribosome-associated protein